MNNKNNCNKRMHQEKTVKMSETCNGENNCKDLNKIESDQIEIINQSRAEILEISNQVEQIDNLIEKIKQRELNKQVLFCDNSDNESKNSDGDEKNDANEIKENYLENECKDCQICENNNSRDFIFDLFMFSWTAISLASLIRIFWV